MNKIKVLNLYGCLGGNRYKWDELETSLEITCVELDPFLCELYQERFPNDIVINTDAHEYLRSNYNKYDIIWSSPPCPSHSIARYGNKKIDYIYPDMSLYQQNVLLESLFKGTWVIENVIPYYKPLIPYHKVGRHAFWSNIYIPGNIQYRKPSFKFMKTNDEISKLSEFHDFDLYQYKGKQRKDKIGRNLVDYVLGKSIFQLLLKDYKTRNLKQPKLL